MSAYNVGRHRHTPEIEQILGTAAGTAVEVIFTPQLVPMDRGILTTTYARPDERGERREGAADASAISTPTSRSSAWSITCPAPRTRPGDELLRHHRPGRPRPGADDQLPGQPDQGGRRGGRAKFQPDVRLSGNDGTVKEQKGVRS